MTKKVISLENVYGKEVSGEIVTLTGGFSPRYHLDRTTGTFSVEGHPIDGKEVSGKILVCDYARGGIAAGWALNMLKDKGFAPRALIFMKANPVMVQGAIFAEIPIGEGFNTKHFNLLKKSKQITLMANKKQIIIEK